VIIGFGGLSSWKGVEDGGSAGIWSGVVKRVSARKAKGGRRLLLAVSPGIEREKSG